MRIENLKHAGLYRAALRVALNGHITEVSLMVVVSSLERGKHDPPGNRVLILSGRRAALIESLAHHEDSIGVIAELELNFG